MIPEWNCFEELKISAEANGICASAFGPGLKPTKECKLVGNQNTMCPSNEKYKQSAMFYNESTLGWLRGACIF
jgi:hypothetical protein